MKRVDRLLARLGLVRMSKVPRVSYDYQTHEVHIDMGMGWANQIHGFICPTPDGPLKITKYAENPLLGFGSMFSGASDV